MPEVLERVDFRVRCGSGPDRQGDQEADRGGRAWPGGEPRACSETESKVHRSCEDIRSIRSSAFAAPSGLSFARSSTPRPSASPRPGSRAGGKTFTDGVIDLDALPCEPRGALQRRRPVQVPTCPRGRCARVVGPVSLVGDAVAS